MSTAKDMIEMLRRHYLPTGKPPAGIFAPEIQAPAGSRRADLIFQGCTAASGNELVGHEVKVSRADVLVELDDPAKSDPWQRYCDRWWLVILDPSLIEGVTLPPSWGVMSPPSGRRTKSMTILTPAPKLNPVDKAPALRTIATWLHWRHDKAANDLVYARREVDRLQRVNADLRVSTPNDSPVRRNHDQVVDEIVRRLGEPDARRGRLGDWQHEVSVDDVVTALRDLGAVYRHAQSVGYSVKNVLRSLERISQGVDTRSVADLNKAVAKFGDPPVTDLEVAS